MKTLIVDYRISEEEKSFLINFRKKTKNIFGTKFANINFKPILYERRATIRQKGCELAVNMYF